MASRRIDDHSSMFGMAPGKDKPFPESSKSVKYESANGAGSVMNYPDMDPTIKKIQEEGVSKVKGRPVKEGSRY